MLRLQEKYFVASVARSRTASGAIEEWFGSDMVDGTARVLGGIRAALGKGYSCSFESNTDGYVFVPDGAGGVNVIETGYAIVNGKQVRTGRHLSGAVWDFGRLIKWLDAVLSVEDELDDSVCLKVYRSEEELLYSPEGRGARGWRDYVRAGKSNWVL